MLSVCHCHKLHSSQGNRSFVHNFSCLSILTLDDGGIIAVQTIYGCHCKNLNTPFHHISAGSPSRIRFNKKENNSHNGFEYSILIFASHVGGTCSCFKLVTSCLMLF